VVFDEAHEIESVAGDYFGTSVSNYKLQDLRRDLSAVGRMKKFGTPELDRILQRLEEITGQFFNLFGEGDRRVAFTGRDAFREDNEEIYSDLLAALDLIGSHLKLLQNPPEEIQPLFRRAMELSMGLRFVMEEDDERYVYWMEKRGRGVFLQATPIDVSSLLSEKLFISGYHRAHVRYARGVGRVRVRGKTLGRGERAHTGGSGALRLSKTGAALRAAGDARTAQPGVHRGGGRASDEDSGAQPRPARSCSSPAINRCGWCTTRCRSRSNIQRCCKARGQESALLDEFRSTPNCVLFATASFWQGVDVPGEQLSCVIIDKLPFAAPNDPVVNARIESIRNAGGNPFYDYQIPQAAIALKQGFGRLIRSKSDRGVWLCWIIASPSSATARYFR